jgi:prevent-host-death family protein
MATWQVQEAKQRFSEVLREAVAKGPQAITRHGQEVAFVVSVDLFHHLTGVQVEIVDYLLHGPEVDDLEIERDTSGMRAVDLDEAG